MIKRSDSNGSYKTQTCLSPYEAKMVLALMAIFKIDNESFFFKTLLHEKHSMLSEEEKKEFAKIIVQIKLT